ncbi:MAG: hypothetical protein AB8H79_23475, partial [Myxococcota bacterium]
MSPYPSPPGPDLSDDRRFRVRQQGRILGVVHIVLGVLTGLLGLLFVVYIIMGAAMLAGGFPPP